jgi:DNA (cytosine-5)-methyltransferase 1
MSLSPQRSRKSATKGGHFSKALEAWEKWAPEKKPFKNKEFQVIDFFSGCGGMSLGFEILSRITDNFNLVGGMDLNSDSLMTYSRNLNTDVWQGDIRKLANSKANLKEFLKNLKNYQKNKPTVLIGCAPCQGFSAHRKKNWNQIDPRNNLVAAFASVASQLQPAVVVMENVPELLSEKYWDYYAVFKKSLESQGFIVKSGIFNCANFFVPQERFRAVIIAMKKDFAFLENKIQRNEFRTVKRSIADLERLASGQVSKDDPFHRSVNHKKSTIDIIKKVPKNGGSRPVGIGPKCLQNFNGFADVYGRLAWDRPAITITHYARNPASGRFCHPDDDRGLTIREVSRLQSFPDKYYFEGTVDSVYRQIGEAVPPLLALAVAECVHNGLVGKNQMLPFENHLIQGPVSNSFTSTISGIKKRKSDKCFQL